MTKKLLLINASMRTQGSRSRRLTGALTQRISELNPGLEITERDLTDGVAFVTAPWIEANFTDPNQRSTEHRAILACSDALFAEVKTADILVIGTPIYNFGVPAALKAWIDMIVRAREAFRYTADGPQGLLLGKSAYVVLTSGGTPAGDKSDFAWPYLKHVLGFIGISDVQLIASSLGGVDEFQANATALEEIAAIGRHTSHAPQVDQAAP